MDGAVWGLVMLSTARQNLCHKPARLAPLLATATAITLALAMTLSLSGCDRMQTQDSDTQNPPSYPQGPQVLDNGLLSAPLETVDLPIANFRQQTPVWCWVTVAQQIIAATRGIDNTPQQCELVATANGVAPDVCCDGYNQQCVTTGSLQQISGLIAHYGGRTSSFAAPTDPMSLYNALRAGHAVIIALNMNGSGHVVVARGMMTQQVDGGYEPVIILNDPESEITQPIPFSQVEPMWEEAIVVN